jgi:hypothetical protein
MCCRASNPAIGWPGDTSSVGTAATGFAMVLASVLVKIFGFRMSAALEVEAQTRGVRFPAH